MYEDKTLVCKDCNQEFILPPVNKNSLRKRIRKRAGRCPSCRAARKITATVNGRCTKQFALLAAAPPKCPSNPAATNPSIAGSASKPEEQHIKSLNKNRTRQAWRTPNQSPETLFPGFDCFVFKFSFGSFTAVWNYKKVRLCFFTWTRAFKSQSEIKIGKAALNCCLFRG